MSKYKERALTLLKELNIVKQQGTWSYVEYTYKIEII